MGVALVHDTSRETCHTKTPTRGCRRGQRMPRWGRERARRRARCAAVVEEGMPCVTDHVCCGPLQTFYFVDLFGGWRLDVRPSVVAGNAPQRCGGVVQEVVASAGPQGARGERRAGEGGCSGGRGGSVGAVARGRTDGCQRRRRIGGARRWGGGAKAAKARSTLSRTGASALRAATTCTCPRSPFLRPSFLKRCAAPRDTAAVPQTRNSGETKRSEERRQRKKTGETDRRRGGGAGAGTQRGGGGVAATAAQ